MDTFDAMGNWIGTADDTAPEGSWDDTTSTDPAQPSMLSVDYYRNKINDFQAALVTLDNLRYDLMAAGDVASLNDESFAEWQALVNEFDSKVETFRTVANTVNLASQGVNALGVSFPQVELPAGLGAVQLIPLVVVGGSLIAVTVLMNWIFDFTGTLRAAIARWQTLGAIEKLPKEQQGPAIAAFTKLDHAAEAAAAAARGQKSGEVMALAKWALIAGIAYMAFKAFKELK